MPRTPTPPRLFDAAPAEPSAAKPAAGNWISAHCDGGARGNPGPAGYGAVVEDAHGTVIAELSEFLGNRTNNFAEYSGLLGVLAWTLENGHTHLRVVSDSELMVKQIQGKYKVNSPDLRPLWEEARRRIAQLEGFSISHALRHKNKAADRLANEAMDRGTKRPTANLAATPTSTPAAGSAPRTSPIPPATPRPPAPATPSATMLRGFTRGGVVHLLGGASLPDGIFVKVLPE